MIFDIKPALVADIEVKPLISHSDIIEPLMSSVMGLSLKTLISSTVDVRPLLSGIAELNTISYNDPIDYLLMQSGVILRTEADEYIKLEGSI